MLVERYLSDNKQMGFDSNGFLIGEIDIFKDESGANHYEYSLNKYQKIENIINNPFSIIIGTGGTGKSTFLNQTEAFLKQKQFKFYRLDLCSLVTENDLSNKIFNVLKQADENEIFYILLDAVDEAIDNNIRNPIELISQTVKNSLDYNKNCKFFITSRTQVNSIENLANELYKYFNISKEEHNYVYELCPLTEDDAKQLALNMGITDVDNFITTINNLSLSNFLTRPITFKAVVDLYKNNQITKNTNHYKIFLDLVKTLCIESSEYRKQAAADKIGQFINYSADELIIVAAKFAIELKLKKKAYISLNQNDTENSIWIEDYLNFSIKTNNGKIYTLNKDIIYSVLNSKLFYKDGSKYLFCQKTYFDFLCTYYLLNIGINIKSFNKLFVFKGKVHPSYYDIISLISIQNDKFFKYYIKRSPESLIFSNIFFNNNKYKKQLLKKYIELVKNGIYSIRTSEDETFYSSKGSYFICKKLYNQESTKYIKKILKSSNEEIITTAIDYIYINKLLNYSYELEKIIYNPKYSNDHRVLAIRIANENIQYKEIINNLYKNLNKMDVFLKEDSKEELRTTSFKIIISKIL